MRPQNQHKLRMNLGIYYVWVGGSCDYGHEDRCSGGAYIMQKDEETTKTYVVSDDHTTEFRMILMVMIHAMKNVPENSDIIFLTNVSYIQQNFDKQPAAVSANSDLIEECIKLKSRHNSVSIKIVPFHKYQELIKTHEIAHKAMLCHRR